MRRVVVTGLGLVSPLGCGNELAWSRLLEARSGYKDVGITRSEYLNPHVIVSDGGDLAVLSYNLRNFIADESGEERLFSAWNSTEVYGQIGENWLIVNSHWSRTQPPASVRGPAD